jgi:hypothetical protein
MLSVLSSSPVSLVKRIGRHSAEVMGRGPSVVTVAPALVGHSNPAVFRGGELVASAWAARGTGARHLCWSFDLEVDASESRCPARAEACDCVVLLSRGGWVGADGVSIAR